MIVPAPTGYASPSVGALKAFQQTFYLPVDNNESASAVCMYCGKNFNSNEEDMVRHVVQDTCTDMPQDVKERYIRDVAVDSFSRKRSMKDSSREKLKQRKSGLAAAESSTSLSSTSSNANLRKDEPWGSCYPKQNCKSLSRYVIFASSPFQSMAEQMEVRDPDRFRHHLVEWNKFPDGTDRITIDGFQPRNDVAGEHCIFIASFHSNDVTLSQFSVFIVLLQSFVASLTILLPYYPVGKCVMLCCVGIPYHTILYYEYTVLYFLLYHK